MIRSYFIGLFLSVLFPVILLGQSHSRLDSLADEFSYWITISSNSDTNLLVQQNGFKVQGTNTIITALHGLNSVYEGELSGLDFSVRFTAKSADRSKKAIVLHFYKMIPEKDLLILYNYADLKTQSGVPIAESESDISTTEKYLCYPLAEELDVHAYREIFVSRTQYKLRLLKDTCIRNALERFGVPSLDLGVAIDFNGQIFRDGFSGAAVFRIKTDQSIEVVGLIDGVVESCNWFIPLSKDYVASHPGEYWRQLQDTGTRKRIVNLKSCYVQNVAYGFLQNNGKKVELDEEIKALHKRKIKQLNDRKAIAYVISNCETAKDGKYELIHFLTNHLKNKLTKKSNNTLERQIRVYPNSNTLAYNYFYTYYYYKNYLRQNDITKTDQKILKREIKTHTASLDSIFGGENKVKPKGKDVRYWKKYKMNFYYEVERLLDSTHALIRATEQVEKIREAVAQGNALDATLYTSQLYNEAHLFPLDSGLVKEVIALGTEAEENFNQTLESFEQYQKSKSKENLQVVKRDLNKALEAYPNNRDLLMIDRVISADIKNATVQEYMQFEEQIKQYILSQLKGVTGPQTRIQISRNNVLGQDLVIRIDLGMEDESMGMNVVYKNYPRGMYRYDKLDGYLEVLSNTLMTAFSNHSHFVASEYTFINIEGQADAVAYNKPFKFNPVDFEDTKKNMFKYPVRVIPEPYDPDKPYTGKVKTVKFKKLARGNSEEKNLALAVLRATYVQKKLALYKSGSSKSIVTGRHDKENAGPQHRFVTIVIDMVLNTELLDENQKKEVEDYFFNKHRGN